MFDQALQLFGTSYYAASVTHPEPAAPLRDDVSADVCVVGAGLAGLCAALELAERGFSVVLLEAREVAWAASGRNGGQVLAGYACGLEQFKALDAHDAQAAMRAAWDFSIEALRLLHERCARYAIDCDYTPGYLLLASRASHVASLRAAQAQQESWGYGEHLQYVPGEQLGAWTASTAYHAGLYDSGSGHIHPLKYALGLRRAALAAGVRLYEHSRVTAIDEGEPAVVRTEHGRVTARFVVMAANVFVGDIAGRAAARVASHIMPVGTTIIATEPLDAQLADSLIRHRACVCDTNFILDYYRLTPDHRMLWGGRSTYARHEGTTQYDKLREKMVRTYPALADARIAYRWGGLIDITLSRAPDFNRVTPNIYYLQGFSGHGVALTGLAGKLAAEAIAGQAQRFDVLARLRHRTFPGGRMLRTPALALGTLYYRLRDALA